MLAAPGIGPAAQAQHYRSSHDGRTAASPPYARQPRPSRAPLTMASLVNPNGLYSLDFYDSTRSPKRKRVPLRVRVKRDAEAIRRKLERDFSLGTFNPWCDDPRAYDRVEVKPETLAEALPAFLETKTQMAPRTYGEYEQQVGRFVTFVGGKTLVRDVTAKDVERWLDSTSAGDVTRRTYTRTVKVFCRWAVKEGIAETVATDGVRLRRVPTKFPRFLTQSEVDRIVNAVRDGVEAHAWLADLIVFAVHTGLRRGEIVNLEWDAVDLDARVLTVQNTETFTTKNGTDRRVPLSDTAASVLERLAEDGADGYVFTTSSGGLTGDYASHAFLRYARAAGIHDCHFHHLRHTACSWLAQRGVPTEAIRRFAGHSSITVTERYTHVGDDLYSSAIQAALA